MGPCNLRVRFELDPIAAWEGQDAGEGAFEDRVFRVFHEQPDFGLGGVTAEREKALCLVGGA